jgi:hypothetical protein
MDATPSDCAASAALPRAFALVIQPAVPGSPWHALLVEPAGTTWRFDSLAGLVRFLVDASGLLALTQDWTEGQEGPSTGIR